jgi:hypothetical protein
MSAALITQKYPEIVLSVFKDLAPSKTASNVNERVEALRKKIQPPIQLKLGQNRAYIHTTLCPLVLLYAAIDNAILCSQDKEAGALELFLNGMPNAEEVVESPKFRGSWLQVILKVLIENRLHDELAEFLVLLELIRAKPQEFVPLVEKFKAQIHSKIKPDQWAARRVDQTAQK